MTRCVCERESGLNSVAKGTGNLRMAEEEAIANGERNRPFCSPAISLQFAYYSPPPPAHQSIIYAENGFP